MLDPTIAQDVTTATTMVAGLDGVTNVFTTEETLTTAEGSASGDDTTTPLPEVTTIEVTTTKGFKQQI